MFVSSGIDFILKVENAVADYLFCVTTFLLLLWFVFHCWKGFHMYMNINLIQQSCLDNNLVFQASQLMTDFLIYVPACLHKQIPLKDQNQQLINTTKKVLSV